jgi:hypothetical protein
MNTISRRQSAAVVLAAVLSVAIAAHQVVLAAGMMLGLRRVVGGLAAWAGLFGLVLLGIAAIVALFGLPSYFRAGARKGKLALRFFRVLAIQCFLYPLLTLLSGIEYTFQGLSAADIVGGCAGLAVGILSTVLAITVSKRGRPTTTGASAGA